MSQRRSSRFSHFVLAASTATFSIPVVGAASNGPADPAKQEAVEYAKILLDENCSNDSTYDPNAFKWDDYSTEILQDLINNLEERSGNFCSPPEIKGMGTIKSKNQQ